MFVPAVLVEVQSGTIVVHLQGMQWKSRLNINYTSDYHTWPIVAVVIVGGIKFVVDMVPVSLV